MGRTTLKAAIVAAAALTMSPALAQNEANTADTTDTATTYDNRADDEDNDFPWGLLGLLGLAGLLGRKRVERDIHVDARKH